MTKAPFGKQVGEWLAESRLRSSLPVADAESALKLANQHAIDLAILDWNLGSGDDGLQLLQIWPRFIPTSSPS